jgi:oligosaccharyltransferase complex subunit delta (ribophorin II)
MIAILPLSLLALGVQASLLTLHSPRLSVASSTGEQLRSETYVTPCPIDDALISGPSISLAQKASIPVSLSQSDVLKLTFQVVDKDTGSGVQPHQTFLRFFDHNTGEEGIQPVRVTHGGKAKFELVSHLLSTCQILLQILV